MVYAYEARKKLGRDTVQRMAEQLCRVQPMPNDLWAKLLNDPLANQLLGRFVRRARGEKVE